MKFRGILGTAHLSAVGGEADPIRTLILRRRLQILIHSYLYYRLDESLITDEQWQTWADELVALQKKHPLICERVDYHDGFEDFDGSTGYHLPYTNPEIASKAHQILNYHRKHVIHINFSRV